MRAKFYEMMQRHAAAMYSSVELTLLKTQVGDLVDSLHENEPIERIDAYLLDLFMTMNTLYSRLKLIKIVADVLQKEEWERYPTMNDRDDDTSTKSLRRM